jgi:hypothetical protein
VVDILGRIIFAGLRSKREGSTMRWPTWAFMSSTRRRSGGRRLGLLCVLLCLTASAEFGSDLPIGYQEITDVGDGNYRVVARCVETRALLEAIAAKTGKPIVFDQPCNTYVSILLPDKVAPPEKWLDYIAGRSILHCILSDEGAWRVYSLSGPQYQSELTEEEILEQYRADLAPKSNLRSGIKSGLVFCRGVLIPPPYEVTFQVFSERSAEVTINGITVHEINRPAVSPDAVIEAPDLPLSGQFESKQPLRRHIAFRLYPSLLTSMSPREARDAVIAFLETQEIVESIVSEQHAVGNIEVYFAGQRSLSDIFPLNYDYNQGNVRQSPVPTRPIEEVAARFVDQIQIELSADKILLYSKGGRYELLAEELGGRVRLARDLPLAQAECVLAEAVGRFFSRELAANMPGRYDAAISLLEAMRLRSSQPAPATEGDDIKRAVDSLVR